MDFAASATPDIKPPPAIEIFSNYCHLASKKTITETKSDMGPQI